MKFIFLLLFTLFIQDFSAQNRVALLDIYHYSGTEDSSAVYSVEHTLAIAGVPYTVYFSLEMAFQQKVIIIPSSIENTTFNLAQKDSLISYVADGGILLFSQVKDPYFNSLLGVSGYKYSTTHSFIQGNLQLFKLESNLLNDSTEMEIKIKDSSFVSGIGTRHYFPTNSSVLASFEDGTAAILKNVYQSGIAYLIGFNWEDIILRNQVSKDFKAAHQYSNGFEIGSDFYALWIRGIYEKTAKFTVNKHTSVNNSHSTLVITHDVDATSAIADIMTDFSSYEYENKIKATYFITTHYNHDSVAKDFWNGYENQVLSVRSKGHEIASHSVSHVPDFDNSTIVQLGDCQAIHQADYHPFYNGQFSSNVTVCGEVKVSKQLLEGVIQSPIRSFRAGYLAYNKNLLEGLEFSNYTFNSSNSANNVLTSFPYFGRLSMSMNSSKSSVLEIPNTISDVFMEDRISETNYPQKVAIWRNVQHKNNLNYAPSILLIHPNRPWKIIAEQNFIADLAPKTTIIPFEEYGNYWKDRSALDYDYSYDSISNQLTIQLFLNESDLNKKISFKLHNGQELSAIKVLDQQSKSIPFLLDSIESNDWLLYFDTTQFSYQHFTYNETEKLMQLSVYPNPSNSNFNFDFLLINDSKFNLFIYNDLGQLTSSYLSEKKELGKHHLSVDQITSSGLYYYKIQTDDQEYFGKIVKY